MSPSLCCCLALVALIGAASATRSNWAPYGRAPRSVDVELTFVLAPSAPGAAAKLSALTADLTNPHSPNFRKWLTRDQLIALMGSSPQRIDAVRSFLSAHGARNIQVASSADFVLATLNVATVEALFGTQMFVHVHNSDAGRTVVRALTDEFVLPSELREHVSFVSRLVDFPPTKFSRRRAAPLAARVPEASGSTCTGGPVMAYPAISDKQCFIAVMVQCCRGENTTDPTAPCLDAVDGPLTSISATMVPTHTSEPGVTLVLSDMAALDCTFDAAIGTVTCWVPFNDGVSSPLTPFTTYNASASFAFGSRSTAVQPYFTPLVASPFVTRQLLAEQYGIPEGTVDSDVGYEQSVVEFIGQYYSPTDFATFSAEMGLQKVPVSVVGPNDPSQPGDEAMLDIEWIAAVNPQPTLFLSFCTDCYLFEWAFWVFNETAPPHVYSISYGGSEADSVLKYMLEMEVQLQKMVALGLTVVVSAGDAGSSNIGHGDTSCGIRPQYPATSPSVLTVSATYFTPYDTPLCNQEQFNGASWFCPTEGAVMGEVGVTADNGMVWTTGGGFSGVFAQPGWQADAVGAYLATPGVAPPLNAFNSTGRGFPDVAAVGHNLLVFIDGVWGVADGTSASAPIFAGILARINYQLHLSGRAPLGAPAAWLYGSMQSLNSPDLLFDVIVGDTYCGDVLHPPHLACCPRDMGFGAAQGWDAVTGIGTPIYERLLASAQA